VECASYCLAEEPCTGFSYDASTQECSLGDNNQYHKNETGDYTIYTGKSALLPGMAKTKCIRVGNAVK
jgi:hypothetical protein